MGDTLYSDFLYKLHNDIFSETETDSSDSDYIPLCNHENLEQHFECENFDSPCECVCTECVKDVIMEICTQEELSDVDMCEN